MAKFLAEDFRVLVNKINNFVIEGEGPDDEESKDTTVNFKDVEKVINTVAETSPMAKVHAVKLVNLITGGIKDKPIHGGMTTVVGNITETLTITLDEGLDAGMKEIVKLVSMIEGDQNAIDQTIFPQIVVELILLCGEISKSTK